IQGCSFPLSPINGYDLSNTPLVPGYYCMDGQYVDNGQVLTLEGDGLYVFYVLSSNKTATASFLLDSGASVVLAGNAQANNVYWIVYDDQLLLAEDSTLVGSVLSSDTLEPFSDESQVTGRLLTTDDLYLYNTTVIVP
ncbi:MAG TPA: ice-binding family protein, partial [Gammaproteobacteria bacterium]|nr:ice-binding family protein [Gammaproteobacteria bacterium]